MKLEGRTAIVTGAGAGIGEATAKLFANQGANVVCNDISKSGVRVINDLKSVGKEGIFVQGDISDEGFAQKLVADTLESYNHLDILVNNAGIVIPGRVDNTSSKDWDRTMEVNLRGSYLVSRFALVRSPEEAPIRWLPPRPRLRLHPPEGPPESSRPAENPERGPPEGCPPLPPAEGPGARRLPRVRRRSSSDPVPD